MNVIFIYIYMAVRASPWLLAVTLVGLTQASHDLLKEEGVVSTLLSLTDDNQNICDKLQYNKYVHIYACRYLSYLF